ncbi:tryptophan 2,3-dioxygenase family protein [Lentzea sp. HUAS12]|uniref:tryptophan 2,3-dioxygenase family protein n=1 Tax=Lentzea sp. HUAS12 TaxID=2951806 RepID=UPI0020A16C28|nr:tryptophan 2,3-dioxygenase family protein [Lentzea sp. HUAS12]USX55460.1 tryptophan 2,3-dioxygenase family protein [Lentzea sp. HUAS12]
MSEPRGTTVDEPATASVTDAQQGSTTPGLASSTRLRILRHGKDRLGDETLEQVRASRADTATGPVVAQFYNCVLDKAENRYSYRSYLALDVLKPLLPTAENVHTGLELVSHLLRDLAEFERMTLEDEGSRLLPRGRPGHQIALRRIRKAAALRENTGPPGTRPRFTDELVEDVVRFSVLPVSDQHDEYLFIRVLQCYETVFTMMAATLEEAVAVTRSGCVSEVAARIESAATTLDQASGLFSLLATMPPAHFRAFRMQTDGSSAIQSEAYKLVEIFCALPRRDRLDSPAFLSVPRVRLRAFSGHDSLSSWHCRGQSRWSDAESTMVMKALQLLERSHQKWKRTHHSIARSMIGSSGGTGGTDGIEYLQRCTENLLFWPIGEQHHQHDSSFNGGRGYPWI